MSGPEHSAQCNMATQLQIGIDLDQAIWLELASLNASAKDKAWADTSTDYLVSHDPVSLPLKQGHVLITHASPLQQAPGCSKMHPYGSIKRSNTCLHDWNELPALIRRKLLKTGWTRHEMLE